MNGDVVLDRSSTLLTSIFKTVAQKSDRFAFYESKMFLANRFEKLSEFFFALLAEGRLE